MAKHHKPTKNQNRKKRKSVKPWTAPYWEFDLREAHTRSEQKLAAEQFRPGSTRTLKRLASLAEEYFGPLGAIVELSDADLTIDGVETHMIGDALTTLDTIGLQKYGAQMERAAELEITNQIQGTESQFTPFGLQIRHNGEPVALIKASHAALAAGHPQITGNFLIDDGLHWDELRQQLGGPSLVTVLSELPNSASDDDKSSAMLASHRIRNERSSGWDVEVQISGDQSGDQIVFSPISAIETIQTPFRFSTARGDTVHGALRLTGPGKILEIVLTRRPDDALLTRAWLFALRAFADLTCSHERVAAEPRPTSTRQQPSKHTPHNIGKPEQQVATIPRSRSNAPSSRLQMSDRLAPTAATASVLEGGHYIAGHKTRLPPAKQARPAARQRAAALAITLGPHETWTREHWRGIAGDKPLLEFVWREGGDRAVTAEAA